MLVIELHTDYVVRISYSALKYDALVYRLPRARHLIRIGNSA